MMTFLAGLLFNHITLALVVIAGVVLAIAALSGRLIMNKYVLSALLAALIGWGLYGYGYTAGQAAQQEKDGAKIGQLEKAISDQNNAILDQKASASALLEKALADTAAAQTALADFKTNLEKDREISQTKNAADLRNRLAGQRLQFRAQIAGCGGGGAATQSAAPGPAGDPAATVIQLPEPIERNLRQLAADAQSLAIDYSVIYQYVNNPALVCELRQ